MSGTGSLLIRNLRKPTDYTRAVQTQDELLRIAIANDANIAEARKAVNNGEVELPTQQQLKSSSELQGDIALQENEARNNLGQLFNYRDTTKIIAELSSDEIFVLNQAFPDIERILKKKFNLALLSPQFFIDFLRRYIDELDTTKGLKTSNNLFQRKFDILTDNLIDIKQTVPTKDIFTKIKKSLEKLHSKVSPSTLNPLIEKVKEIERVIPTKTELDNIDYLRETDKQEIIANLQEATNNLPTKTAFENFLANYDNQKITLRDYIEQIAIYIDGLRADQVRDLSTIRDNIREDIEGLKQNIREGTIPKKQNIGRPKKPPAVEGEIYDGPPYGPEYEAFLERKKNERIGATIPSDISLSSASTPATFNLYEAKKAGRGIKTRKIGKGIEYEPEPTYKEFGKYVIHMPNLKERDILNVKFKSLGRIPKYKPISISEVLKEVILDLVNTGKINHRIYSQVPMEEKKLFENISHGAGILHKLGIDKVVSPQEKHDVDRFNILRGELMAGNNSIALEKELRKLVVKFMNDGRISRSDGLNLLMELSV
jgi:hypothetical protein